MHVRWIIIDTSDPLRVDNGTVPLPIMVYIDGSLIKNGIEYAYRKLQPRKLHPVLQFLPTKLAEWIGENMQDELGLPEVALGCLKWKSEE